MSIFESLKRAAESALKRETFKAAPKLSSLWERAETIQKPLLFLPCPKM